MALVPQSPRRAEFWRWLLREKLPEGPVRDMPAEHVEALATYLAPLIVAEILTDDALRDIDAFGYFS